MRHGAGLRARPARQVPQHLPVLQIIFRVDGRDAIPALKGYVTRGTYRNDLLIYAFFLIAYRLRIHHHGC